MKLSEYLEKNQISPSSFADRVGISRQTVYGILNNKMPLLDTALTIELVTLGLVTCEDLCPVYEDIISQYKRKSK